MKVFVIYDTTANTGKHYIDSEGNNVEDIERAEKFHLEIEAKEAANTLNNFAESEGGKSWAVVHEIKEGEQ